MTLHTLGRRADAMCRFIGAGITTTGIALIIAALAFASLVAPSEAAPTLHVGDQVQVNVFNHPELSGMRTIGSDGSINVPLVGNIGAAGLAPDVVATNIRSSLRHYIPYVAVNVQRAGESAVISVVGWPSSVPDGSLKYVPGASLSSAVAALRGAPGSTTAFDPYHSRVDLRNVVLERNGKAVGHFDLVQLAGAGRSGPLLQPGDVLRFSDKPLAVDVRGAVRHPGPAYLSTDEPLSDAFEQVGGLSENAMTGRLVLRRDGVERSVSLTDDVFLHPAQPSDALLIRTAPQVVVGGIIQHAGSVLLKSDASLLSAIFNAGGPDKESDLGHVRVIRDSNVKVYDVTRVTRGDLTQNPMLRDGDEVYVPRGRALDSLSLAAMVNALRWTLFR